jgi:hypothetical protein
MMSLNTSLKRVLEPKREDETGGFKKVLKGEFPSFHSSPV